MKDLTRELQDTEFQIEFQYAFLGVILILIAVIPAQQASVEAEVPIPGPSISARVVWLGDPARRLSVGNEIALAKDQGSRLRRLDAEFPQAPRCRNFVFRITDEGSARLLVWLAGLPDWPACEINDHKMVFLLFDSALANEVEEALEDPDFDPAKLPSEVVVTLFEAGVPASIDVPEHLGKLN